MELWRTEIPYEITIWTGDVRGAGTDANVFVQLYGENGKTEEHMLRNRSDNFEQGQVDKFKVTSSWNDSWYWITHSWHIYGTEM